MPLPDHQLVYYSSPAPSPQPMNSVFVPKVKYSYQDHVNGSSTDSMASQAVEATLAREQALAERDSQWATALPWSRGKARVYDV